MTRMQKMSLKAFWEAVEQRLQACSADELRSILRALAQETLPVERQAFVDKLQPVAESTAVVERAVGQEELLADIDDLLRELQEEMEDADAWEERYEWDEYDDEDSLGPYDEFVEPLNALFDRTEAVFDAGNMTLARAAYQKLFEVLGLEDDYGRGMRAEHLQDVDVGEARARYLRAIYETELPEHRSQVLFEHMQLVQSLLYRPRPMLDDIIQISPRPLPDHDRFFPGWIACLRQQSGREADTWLREAIRLSQGVKGLEELARTEGAKRPRAYLDWFTALEDEGKPHEVLIAAQEALRTLPDTLPIRAAVADHLCTAATRLNDTEALRAGRWEAFTAQPTLVRLLDLWDAAPPGTERTQRIQQAAQHVKDCLAHPPDHRAVGALEDDLESPVWIHTSVLAHAYLLAADWDAAHQLVAPEEVLGWSSRSNSQGLVMSCFLVRLSEKLPGMLPPNLTQLWQWGLQNSLGFGSWHYGDTRGTNLLTRLQRVYEECLPQVSWHGDKQAEILSWCLEVAKRRVNAIVSNQHRGSYNKAAVVLAACAEMLRLLGRNRDASALLDDVRQQFPRHRAFQAEVKTAVQRVEQSLR